MNRQYGHRIGKGGRVEVVETTGPRRLKGCTVYSAGTLRIGPWSRIAAAVVDRIGR